MSEFLLLVLAGVGAGLTSTLAGLASLISYPALLAFGLPPIAANVTNTTAMTVVIPASALGARQELRGLGRRLAGLCLVCGIGGALGAGLLLTLPEESFEAAVPCLIAFGALLLLFRNQVRRLARRNQPAHLDENAPAARQWPWVLAIGLTGVYAGYFGAAAGIIMLAILSLRYTEPLAVTNAVKTIVTGAGNLVAAVSYALVAPVDWSAVPALGAGLLVGSWIGPKIGRHLPADPLRHTIGAAGLVLAVYLAI